MSDRNNSQNTLSLLWETELEILEAIGALCKEHNLVWFLDSGTALGAARHQGFIPWDDDVDIGMPRADYDKFLEIAPASLPQDFSLHTAKNDPNYSCLFAKVYKDSTRFVTKETQYSGANMGIFVDIFPYETISSDEKTRQKQIKNAQRAVRLMYLYHSKYITVPHKGLLGAIEKAGCYLLHYFVRTFHSRTRIFAKYDRAVSSDHTINDPQPLCGALAGSGSRVMETNNILPPSYAQFEGRTLPVPHYINNYLTESYGDWETLPPMEERKTHLPIEVVFDTNAQEISETGNRTKGCQ